MKNRNMLIGIMATAAVMLTACEEGDRGQVTQRGHSMYTEWSGRTEAFVKVNVEPLFRLNEWMTADTKEERDSLEGVYAELQPRLVKSYGDTVFLLTRDSLYNVPTPPMLVLTHGADLQQKGTQWEVLLNVPRDYEYAPTGTTSTEQPMLSPASSAASGYYVEGNGKALLPLAIQCREEGKWTLRDDGDADVRKVFYVNWTVERKVRMELLPEETDHRYVLTGSGRYAFGTYRNPDMDIIMDYDMEDVSLNNRKGQCFSGTVNMTATERVTEAEQAASAVIGNRSVEITYKDITEHYNEY